MPVAAIALSLSGTLFSNKNHTWISFQDQVHYPLSITITYYPRERHLYCTSARDITYSNTKHHMAAQQLRVTRDPRRQSIMDTVSSPKHLQRNPRNLVRMGEIVNCAPRPQPALPCLL
ncbi:hypothetical protein BU23DRAFT_207063 [Bimuria novae-zelandiae CBS 107.79]|uniref:Uncharacterized protein n=1 Tax=Bimuria novae-zelandiae CBS 107.79 TaxID=1447943 RepID=A0A6A5V216_9PLEO|nr:hypothetical protein BU23DRAFT_207063 [Bimuria novae-zelandiae CBS 107.79]